MQVIKYFLTTGLFPQAWSRGMNMKKKKLKIISISILIFCVQQILFAYATSPRPLRKLIIESELIVYAEVVCIETEKAENKNNAPVVFSHKKATLRINEILKGKAGAKSIKVIFQPNMVSPLPAIYEKGSSVLVFLDKNEDGTYTTHAEAYGLKNIDATDFQIYKARILEMEKILSQKNISDKQITDWLFCVLLKK